MDQLKHQIKLRNKLSAFDNDKNNKKTVTL